MVFERVLVGFDASPAAQQALAVALRLRAPEAQVVALTVAETHYATHAGMDAVAWHGRICAEADEARAAAEDALAEVPGGRAEVASGHAAKALLATAASLHADLVAVGAHGHSRMSGILLGDVATRIVHDAHCSVLVARGDAAGEFPASITVGTDGSPSSLQAVAVAEALGAGSAAHLRQVTAKGGAVHTLLEAGASSDLLVLGSRGLHGLRALGSVAERVAHGAACSVLVVREPLPERLRHERPEDADRDRADDPARRAAVDPGPADGGMALAARAQGAVQRERERAHDD